MLDHLKHCIIPAFLAVLFWLVLGSGQGIAFKGVAEHGATPLSSWFDWAR